MNHEHPSANDSGAEPPRHRADIPGGDSSESIPSVESDAYVLHVIRHAPTSETAEAIADAYGRHGTAFALYLTLSGVDRYVRDYGPGHTHEGATGPQGIERDFQNKLTTAGSPRGTRSSTTPSSPSTGAPSLSRLLEGRIESQHVVTFDRDAIYDFAAAHYEVVETDDGLYAFWR
ncbi:hypothetical protein G5V59_19955 [Nocardioides sp. W3-2-3]|uniref:hypothetical protein n=1 Tax=Nocardioides convexus TaxID=2712224 RepID=UPI0024181CC5|nr:hypothetical protein [Nocardioides convexus]NHA01340.1 hypothetical protein [Nocardioides convexus]